MAAAIGVVSFGITLGLLVSGRSSSPPPELPPPAAAPAPPSPAPPSAPVDFDTAMRAAVRIGTTPEGLKYQDDAAPVLSTALQQQITGCLDESPDLDVAAFAIVVGVAPDGAVRATWAQPETALARCVLHGLSSAALPAPTVPEAWMAANVRPEAGEAKPEPER
jgi:hypothetical protein